MSRFAGGQQVRRLLGRMPRESIRWCSFGAYDADDSIPEYRGFLARDLHWRIVGTTLGYLYDNELQSKKMAARMWAWLAPFEPQVLWVVPEMSAVYVARHLAEIGNLPIHATIHDAPELSVGEFVSPVYLPFYMRSIRKLLARSNGVDFISSELMAHTRKRYTLRDNCRLLVTPPSLDPACVQQLRARREEGARKIGLCGTFRMAAKRWSRFLALLGQVEEEIEFVSFTKQEDIPLPDLPANVRFRFLPYAEREIDVARTFCREGIDACYLGVWTAAERKVFGSTSLSSKILMYTASCTPLIVDAGEDSVAWRLVGGAGGGIRISGDEANDLSRLKVIFGDPVCWRKMAEGSRQLALTEFNLDRNADAFKESLCQTANR